jgi:site-specific recombinase XerD
MIYPSLSCAVDGFLLNISAAGRSSYTIRNYRAELIRFTNFAGDLEINQVSSKQIEDYLLYLKNDFRITHIATTPITPKKISQKTLSNVHGTLAVFWKWASKEFQLSNPFKVAPIKYYSKPISPLKESEIELLLSACRKTQKTPKVMKAYSSKRTTSKRDRAIILTLLDTGMRVSELCGIRIKDYDSESGRLMITGKGLKTRFVYLGKVSSQSLWSYLLERYPNQKPLENDPLFTDHSGIYPLTRHGVLQLVKRLGKKAGVLNVHPHRFRHTFAVEFLPNGGNVFELQQLLDHSNLDMVKRYVQLVQIDLETSAHRASPADRWKLR